MKYLITIILLLILSGPAWAVECEDCPYDKPCQQTKVQDCLYTVYNVFCMRDEKGMTHWFSGPNRGDMIKNCQAEIENPFAQTE